MNPKILQNISMLDVEGPVPSSTPSTQPDKPVRTVTISKPQKEMLLITNKETLFPKKKETLSPTKMETHPPTKNEPFSTPTVESTDKPAALTDNPAKSDVSPSEKSSASNRGMIIGGVMGGLAALVGVSAAGLLVWKKKRKTKQAKKKASLKFSVSADSLVGSASPQFATKMKSKLRVRPVEEPATMMWERTDVDDLNSTRLSSLDSQLDGYSNKATTVGMESGNRLATSISPSDIAKPQAS
eukprot:GHVT01091803.1.p1 GENE.GHVT01091803.1~~GHVT01091803.1.p1  ORF type:complete len:242 (+),score=39.30 GHVT01091803.1:269-994(+)